MESFLEGKKVLRLTLKKHWFDLMVDRTKRFEVRKKSKWIESRLFDKKGNPILYDYVLFVNGYGDDKPVFICDYLGYCIAPNIPYWVNHKLESFEIECEKGDYVIMLGIIYYKKNIGNNEK